MKKQDSVMVIAIILSITIILGIDYSTKYIQPSILLSDLETVTTDINIAFQFSYESLNSKLNELAREIEKIELVKKILFKNHLRGNGWNTGDLYHYLWFDSSNNSEFNLLENANYQFDIIGFKDQDFEDYHYFSKLGSVLEGNTTLSLGKVIIPQEIAQSYNKTIGDVIYLHYANFTGVVEGFFLPSKGVFPLEINNILIKPSKPVLSDLTQNPFLIDNEGNIDNIAIIDWVTLFSLLESLLPNYMEIITNQVIMSVYLDKEKVIQRFNLLKSSEFLGAVNDQIIETVLSMIPSVANIMISDNIGFELKDFQKNLEQYKLALFSISVPIILLVIFLSLLIRSISINTQIQNIGVLISRGLPKTTIKWIFFVEGGIIGLIAGIAALIPLTASILILALLIPSIYTINEILVVVVNDIFSLMINTILISFFLGISLNYVSTRRITDRELILLLIGENEEVEEWFEIKNRRIGLFLALAIILMFLWIITRFIVFFGVSPRFLDFIKDIISVITLSVPFLIILILLRITISRRDIFIRLMKYTSFFLQKNIRELVSLDYLRRPKNLSSLVFLSTITFSMSILPIVSSQSAHDAGLEQIKMFMGTDIKITSTYQRLQNISYSSFNNISPHIEGFTQIVLLDSKNGLKSHENGSNIAYPTFDVIGINPESFVNIVHLERYMTPNTDPIELFMSLESDKMTALAPLHDRDFEDIKIGEKKSFEFSRILEPKITNKNYTISGFYYLLPGYKPPSSFQSPLAWIFNLKHLRNTFDFPSSSTVTLLVKIDSNTSKNQREHIFINIKTQFKDCNLEFLDEEINSFLKTMEGKVVLFWDSVFFFVSAIGLFGIGLAWFQSYNRKRSEFVIYISRGMRRTDIAKMLASTLIAVNLLGAIFGISLGIILSLSFFNFLMFIPTTVPITPSIPWFKILLYLSLLTIIHILEILFLIHWEKRKDILTILRSIE
ncbi:MAG: FtsX-like permease family protein [Candidatus Hodarchaeota archaeon]